MYIKLATAEHLATAKNWNSLGRIEELTCRPVANGKRIPPTAEFVTLAFCNNSTDELLGKFTYFDINPRNRSAEFGYTVNPAWRSQGIGKKMVWAGIDYVFSATNFNKLYCQTAAFNKPSVRLLESLGLHRDGILREHHELDGTFYNDYIYSILRAEWLLTTSRLSREK